jgi:OFA family oxalate/formate antiporter-like MFS transporter
MALGVLYAWSVFREPLSGLFETWTAVDMSWIFTITMLGFLIGGVISGRLTLKIRHRYVVLIGAALCLTGFVGASQISAGDAEKSLMTMYIFYGVFCGLGIGMPYNAVLGAMLKWFPGKEGFASGVMLMGFGFGGLALGNIIGTLIASFGVNRTFVVLAVGIAMIAGGGSFIIRTPNETSVKETEPQKNKRRLLAAAPITDELSTGQMVKTAAFAILIMWMISTAMGGLMVMNSAASIAIFYGFTAGAGLAATVFNGIGRMLFGILFDRLGSRAAMMIVAACLITAGFLMLIGAMSNSYTLILAGLPLTGLGYGGAPVITSAYVNRWFGPKNYTANLSVANLSVMVSSVAGPVLSGSLQDMSGGAFGGSFAAIGILGVIALVPALLAKKS